LDPYNKSHFQSIYESIKQKYDIRANVGDLTALTIGRLQQKLYRMLSQLRRCSGGRAMYKLLSNWKSERYNCELRYTSKKRKMEEELEMEKAKRLKIEQELRQEKEASNNLKAKQDIRLQILSKRLIKGACQRIQISNTKKGYQYSKSHKYRLKRQRKVNCNEALAFLRLQEITPIRLEVLNHKEEHEIIELDPEKCQKNETTSEDGISTHLYAKDKFNISHSAYHELSMINKKLPRSHLIKAKLNQLNSSFHIKPIGRGVQGFQQSIKTILPNIIASYIRKNSFQVMELVKVKLSGDGTWVGNKLHLISITFTLPDFPNAKSSDGNTLLAIFKGSEEYKFLSNALLDIKKDIEEFTTFHIDRKQFSIQYYLGGDLKFLNIVCGIDSCSSTFSCIWCKCKASERHDTTREWSMTNPEKGARTIDEIKQCSKEKTKAKKFNCSNPPIFESIPLVRVVPDRLHLFLRIADQLINQLIKELKNQDNIAKLAQYSSIEREKYKHIQGFEEFIKELGISWSFYLDKDTKLIKSRTFTGPEKYKIIKNIHLPNLLPNIDAKKMFCIKQVWHGFTELITTLDRLDMHLEDLTISFIDSAKEWLNTYTKVYPTKDATPYMHILVYHVAESIKLNGNLCHFTQQGLEKLNDDITKWYFGATSLCHEAAMKQIIQKQNRIRKLEFDGAKREAKFQWTCKNCRKKGHSYKTCTELKAADN